MQKTFLSVALLVLIGAVPATVSGAFAQGGTSTAQKNSDKPLPQAPSEPERLAYRGFKIGAAVITLPMSPACGVSRSASRDRKC